MNTLEYARSELNKYCNLVFGKVCEISLINKNYGNAFDDEIDISVSEGKGSIWR